ncbi:hypothetical protein U1Q18_048564 [Sarracenia purpurea var. burkii]
MATCFAPSNHSLGFTELNPNRPSYSLPFNVSLRTTTAVAAASTTLTWRPNHIPKRPVLLFSGGGGIDGGSGRNSGGGGGGGGGEGDEQGFGGNREDAFLAMAEIGRSLESLPKDFAAAIESGRIPGSIVVRYFELEKSPLLRWLLQFGGFKERLLADDLFFAKVFIECGVGMFTKVMAIIADFMLVYLPAPTVSLRPPIAVNAGSIAKFFYGCPDNAFQRNGTKLFAVGTASSLVNLTYTFSLSRFLD